MAALERKRCTLCAATLDTVQLHGAQGFASESPALLCPRCDEGRWDDLALFAPDPPAP